VDVNLSDVKTGPIARAVKSAILLDQIADATGTRACFESRWSTLVLDPKAGRFSPGHEQHTAQQVARYSRRRAAA
jgi:hypothetical protein